MKKRYLLIGALFLFACNGRLDEMRPHNMAEAESYLGSFNNIVNATSGLYGQFLMQAGGYSESHHYHGTYHVLRMVLCLLLIICEPRMLIFS